MKFVFLMDPLEKVIYEKDTTFALMLGAHRKKHKVYFLPRGGTIRKNGKLYFHVTEVIPQKNKNHLFIKKANSILSENVIDVLFIRTDPPFNSEYLMDTWLLDLMPKHIPVINNPSGIRTVNEKLWATQFSEIVPRTMVSRRKDELLNFLGKENAVIAKPTDGHGGQGVFRVRNNDTNAIVTLEALSRNWTKEIILQQFIQEAEKGDKRILLLNGEPLGAVLRVHAKGDHRNNFFAGGKPRATEITPNDQQIIKILRPHLQKLGLYFVGIDILGKYLIEVNVTSPTCLQEINRLNKVRLEDKVIAFTEELVTTMK